MKSHVKKPAYWVVVNPQNNKRLCRDGLWREFAYFGTYPECVKIYRKEGWARRAAGKYLPGKWEILGVHEGESMDACGRIFNKDNKWVRGGAPFAGPNSPIPPDIGLKKISPKGESNV